jgi:hypothetical protein
MLSNSVPIAKKTQGISITKPSRLMLFGEADTVVPVDCEHHTKQAEWYTYANALRITRKAFSLEGRVTAGYCCLNYVTLATREVRVRLQ